MLLEFSRIFSNDSVFVQITFFDCSPKSWQERKQKMASYLLYNSHSIHRWQMEHEQKNNKNRPTIAVIVVVFLVSWFTIRIGSGKKCTTQQYNNNDDDDDDDYPITITRNWEPFSSLWSCVYLPNSRQTKKQKRILIKHRMNDYNNKW